MSGLRNSALPLILAGEKTMRHALMIAAALSLLTGFAAPAYAQKIDANGRCHDKAGKFAKMEVCKGGAAASSASAAPKYKLDAKGNCHDAKGKMAKKELCASAPKP